MGDIDEAELAGAGQRGAVIDGMADGGNGDVYSLSGAVMVSGEPTAARDRRPGQPPCAIML